MANLQPLAGLKSLLKKKLLELFPAIELIRSMPEAHNVSISVDTYRASVAEKAVASGADIINDVSAGVLDPEMLSTVAPFGEIHLPHAHARHSTDHDGSYDI